MRKKSVRDNLCFRAPDGLGRPITAPSPSQGCQAVSLFSSCATLRVPPDADVSSLDPFTALGRSNLLKLCRPCRPLPFPPVWRCVACTCFLPARKAEATIPLPNHPLLPFHEVFIASRGCALHDPLTCRRLHPAAPVEGRLAMPEGL